MRERGNQTGWLIVILALAILTARAIAQEIVIEPTNGRAPSANRVARPTQAEPQGTTRAVSPARPRAAQKTVAKKKEIAVPAKSPQTPKVAALPEAPVESAPARKAVAAPARPGWAMSGEPTARNLQVEITEAFARHPELGSRHLTVHADENSVTLEGQVVATSEKVEAERLAQSYAWNQKVVNRVEVLSGTAAQK